IMQDFTATDAAAMATGEAKTLRDSRDGQDYTVAKLADGNVWMVDNLNLGATTLSSDLTSANTNLSTTISASTFSNYKITSGTATYTAAEYIPVSGTDATSQTSYGTLYNYCAASAGTICASSNSSDAQYDICPKGWRLPTGGDSGEFQALYNIYNTDVKMLAPVSQGGAAFALAGYFYDGALEYHGSYGIYWSSTRYNSTNMYRLFLRTSFVNPAVFSSRRNGYSIRCVLKPTMQGFTATDAATMATGETKTLADSRDGQDYTVAKLPDGNVWMTKNLNLAGGTTLTPADSNVSAGCNLGNNCTLPASSTSGFSDDSTAYVYNGGSTSCSSSSPCYSYYSHIAATAGTSPSSGNATSDICPKGWRLPTQAEFITLMSSYNIGDKLTASPFLGVYAGFYSSSSFASGGSDGYYWSSTASSSTSAYNLGFNSSSAYVRSYSKRYGLSVRCVLKPTMQDFTASDASAMATGETKTLTDSRDGQDYTVAKLPDGNVWMTRNLDLAGGTTLTPATSNVSSNYTLPASSTSGFSDNATAYVYNSGSTSCGSSSPCYSYYSYAAATAGTGASISSGDATSDICPKGWRLPTRAEFNTLISTYTTGATLTASPFLGVYAGSYSRSLFEDGGSYGYYWSSTAGSSTGAYYLNFYSSNADVYSYNKRDGSSVRCVLQ
ncbi:DUF1566 domain-containing protein, partial [Candidatus Saccharibacteria bacterium]|nr:DUF1566 domain-containing protein [Candidatus Saccharibacteria bacterium]